MEVIRAVIRVAIFTTIILFAACRAPDNRPVVPLPTPPAPVVVEKVVYKTIYRDRCAVDTAYYKMLRKEGVFPVTTFVR